MKLGAEDKKKVRMLGVLGVILLGAMYYAFFSGPSVPSSAPATAVRPNPDAALPAIATAPEPQAVRAPGRSSSRGDEFHPVLRSKRPEDRIDPTSIDPTLKLDLLARLQEVPPAGGGRNLFQFGTAPPKELPKGPEPKVAVARLIGPPLIGPADLLPKPPVKAAEPPPAPFSPKYYGLATSAANGRKRAFFLDGEDIIIRSEGETVKGQFRLVRIGATQVVVEDTSTKREQTVKIVEDAQA
jgi:hypothetical protein